MVYIYICEHKSVKVPLEMVTMLLVNSPKTSITTCSQEVTSHVTRVHGKTNIA